MIEKTPKMTAQIAGMRNGLVLLGFLAIAAQEIVVNQGYTDLTNLAELTDVTINDLIKTIRKPGGNIPNPAFQQYLPKFGTLGSKLDTGPSPTSS
jgi:hypothetical protein